MGPPYKDRTSEELHSYKISLMSDQHQQSRRPGKKDAHYSEHPQSCDCGWIADSPKRQSLVWHILCETCLVVREAIADLLRALAGLVDPY